MFQDWLNKTIGKQVDIDKYAGDQCVDVAMSWAEYLYPGHKWPELLGYGNAKDLFSAASPIYFDKVMKNPQQGDMVVFGATNTNPYGHIAVVINAGDTLDVIEQNGFNPSGVAYEAHRPYANIIGYLRPKGASMAKTADQKADELYKLLDQTNKNVDKLYQIVNENLQAINKTISDLYIHLDQTNKRVDKLEKK